MARLQRESESGIFLLLLSVSLDQGIGFRSRITSRYRTPPVRTKVRGVSDASVRRCWNLVLGVITHEVSGDIALRHPRLAPWVFGLAGAQILGACSTTPVGRECIVSAVSPSAGTSDLDIGGNTTLTANVSTGNCGDSPPPVVWSVNQPGIVTLSGTTGNSIIVTGVAQGSAVMPFLMDSQEPNGSRLPRGRR